MDGVYELKGTERKEVKREKVPCGECVETFYYDPISGKLLRKDVNVEVSKEFLAKAMGSTQEGD